MGGVVSSETMNLDAIHSIQRYLDKMDQSPADVLAMAESRYRNARTAGERLAAAAEYRLAAQEFYGCDSVDFRKINDSCKKSIRAMLDWI